MRRIFLLFVAVLTFNLVFSQTSSLEVPISFFKHRNLKNIENYSISDSETENLAIILMRKGDIFCQLYSKDFQLLEEVQNYETERKYSNLIGYSENGKDSYSLIFASVDKKEFESIIVNFENSTITNQKIDLDLGKEIYLSTVQYNGKPILLTATRDNMIILREFTDSSTIKEYGRFQIDQNDKEQQLINTDYFFFFASNRSGTLTKIDSSVPNKLKRTSKENKLYLEDDKIFLTFENDDSHTSLNVIDLKNNNIISKTLPYPEGRTSRFKNFNSFVKDEHFFHIASSKEEMLFQVKDFDNNVIKDYYVAQEDDILFRNSDLIQDGSTFQSKKRLLETTKQYLRKITSGNLGIAIHEQDDFNIVTLGSHTVIKSGGGYAFPAGPAMLPVSSGPVFIAPTYNPTFSSFNSYGASKDVYFNTVLDEDYDHDKSATYDENIFDRIKNYQDTLKWEEGIDVFIHNKKTFFSHFNVKKKTYSLVQF